MINTHFDLQNIITEIESSAQSREAASNGGSDDFSATMKRLAESGSHRSTESRPLVGKDEMTPDSDESEDSANEESAQQSGNVLPLLPPKQPALNQMTLGSKRAILIGSSNLSESDKKTVPQLTILAGRHQSEQTSAEGFSSDKSLSRAATFNLVEKEQWQTSKRAEKDASVDASIKGQDRAIYLGKSSQLQIKPDLISTLSNTGVNAVVGDQSEFGSSGLSQLLETRASEAESVPRIGVTPTDRTLDVEALQQGLRNIIKNQIVSSFSGKNVSVKMVLTPESLGEIQVDLLFTKDRDLQVTLRPETTEVARLLHSNSASLREQLSSEHKGQFSFNVSEEADQNSSFGRNQGNNPDMTANNLSMNSGNRENPESEQDRSGVTIDRSSSSLIDTFA